MELLTAAAEQTLAKYEEQVARLTADPEDDDAHGASSCPSLKARVKKTCWRAQGWTRRRFGVGLPSWTSGERSSHLISCVLESRVPSLLGEATVAPRVANCHARAVLISH